MWTIGKKFRKSHHEESNFELQITALIDTLVIILIFMLKTTALESLELDQQKNLSIPMVNDGISQSEKKAKLSINSEGLYWNGSQIIFTENFAAVTKEAQAGGPQWSQLTTVIQESASQEKTANKFDGKLLLEADKNTPYVLLDQALKIARQHGYKDIRFVAARYN